MNLARLPFPVLLAGLFLAGCAVGPNYQRPAATTIPPVYDGATNQWKVAQPQANLPKGNWWELFGDPELDRLEVAAGNANQQLKAAVARFDEARGAADVAQSGLFPHIGLDPYATREGDSRHRPLDGPKAGPKQTYSYNTFTVPLDLSYEVDLWGHVRRMVEAANAEQQANADDIETVKLSIQAEVAVDYFTLRALDAQKALLISNVDVFTKSLELTRNRRAGGIAADLDVAQAETILKTTEAELPATMLQRAQFAHALAVLTGENASLFRLAEQPINIPAPSIPPGLPSQLLERRPDVSAAERRMAAANANIGVAKAAFFPLIQFNGLGGFESLNVGTLFNWGSRFWSAGPSITFPIFDAGNNLGQLRIARATYNEMVADYRQTVLAAFADVEDNLAAQNMLALQDDAESAALVAARRQLEIANNRYRAGLVTYLEVATAQSTALDIESTTVQLRGQQLVAAVTLVKSLGGGWQVPAQTSAKQKP